MDITLNTEIADIDFHTCDKRLLSYIKNNKDDKAISMIKKNVGNTVVDYDLLLYYAAFYGNERIIQHLIGLGANVNIKMRSMLYNTPLMVAIAKKQRNAVRVLLEADADIHTTNHLGVSSLQLALNPKNWRWKFNMLQLILRSMRKKISPLEMFVERLIAIGCSLVHVAFLKDVKVMKCMLESGIDVNAKVQNSMTALDVAFQTAVLLNDLEMVRFLFEKVTDHSRLEALYATAFGKQYNVMKYLLQRGVDPNGAKSHECPPLYPLIITSDCTKNCYNCIELLLQQGADPQIVIFNDLTIFELFKREPFKLIPVTAHLAMLEMLGTPILDRTYAGINLNVHYKNYYQSCQEILKVEIFQSITLFNLLVDSRSRIKIYMRNKKFIPKLLRISRKRRFVIFYPYYFNVIKKRILRIIQDMRLEYFATKAISKISNCNLPKTITKQIVGYLDQQSQEKLVLLTELNYSENSSVLLQEI